VALEPCGLHEKAMPALLACCALEAMDVQNKSFTCMAASASRHDRPTVETSSVQSLAVSGLDAEASELSTLTSSGEAEEASESEGLPPS
jgi:hypothetical protein